MVSAAHQPHDHTNHGAIRVSNALAPDYLWVALGAPHEQAFVEEVTPGLFNIGVIRMSGGLFNFLSSGRVRAPVWMQHAGLEWAWRILLEPRHLFRRYLTTTPRALYSLLNRGRSTDISGTHNQYISGTNNR
jgi:N-acetylglucosaminyldiphosphoundecaprenol N-acetyl-beta-D-mannosaminyltransferase